MEKFVERMRKPSVFFTADTHFGNQRALVLSRRPFSTTGEMDWTMVENWNSRITENDTVYHLGDFGNPDVIKKLNGNLLILPGNYDSLDTLDCLVSNMLEKKGNIIILQEPQHEITLNGYDFILAHQPFELSLLKNNNTFALFGHIHKLQMIKSFGLNVGVDCHNFSPINLETILFYRNGILNHYDENVFC